MQAQVDFAAGAFKSAVLAKRPGVPAEMMQGQYVFAAQGVSTGLVDELANSLNDVIAAVLLTANAD